MARYEAQAAGGCRRTGSPSTVNARRAYFASSSLAVASSKNCCSESGTSMRFDFELATPAASAIVTVGRLELMPARGMPGMFCGTLANVVRSIVASGVGWSSLFNGISPKSEYVLQTSVLDRNNF